MSNADWVVLAFTLAGIVGYGIYKGRGNRDIDGYLLAGKQMPWYHVLFSMMATQASAITFLSLPGQAYADGMRFVQFYFGLPLAMIILCSTFFPVFQKLRVFTAYEYLEQRFDLKTRKFTALLFLLQRGISTGISIYAPAIVLSAILNIDIRFTTVLIGLMVIIYTTYGGSKAVSYTQLLQMTIITGTLLFTGILLLLKIRENISIEDAFHLAGAQGKMNIINFKLDFSDRYNVWSGIIGGFFLQLSYFGTDHSQVSRYLTAKSMNSGRTGLLLNGLVKIPMQFGILLIGVMVFIYFQFATPPLFFNEHLKNKITSEKGINEFKLLEQKHNELNSEKQQIIKSKAGQDEITIVNAKLAAVKTEATDLVKKENRAADTSDSNYIFLWFVTHHLPQGLIGLLVAVIFMASMGSLSSGLNSLASCSVVDIYKRSIHKTATDLTYLQVSRYATLGWGLFCIGAALLAGKMGNLIEVVNILGSLFYGTILGIFIVAFYVKYIGGNAVFYAAVITELLVVYAWYFNLMAFLWLNLAGCILVVVLGAIFQRLLRK